MDLKMKSVSVGHYLIHTPRENIVAMITLDEKRTLNNQPWMWRLSGIYQFGGAQSYLRYMECRTLQDALETLQTMTDKHGLVAR